MRTPCAGCHPVRTALEKEANLAAMAKISNPSSATELPARGTPATVWLDHLLAVRNVSASAKWAGFVIANLAGQRGIADPPVWHIADVAGFNRKAAFRHIRSLKERGLVRAVAVPRRAHKSFVLTIDGEVMETDK